MTVVRPPLAPGLQACRHDGTVHPFNPLTALMSHALQIPAWGPYPPGVCPPVLWPTTDPLGPVRGACGGPDLPDWRLWNQSARHRALEPS